MAALHARTATSSRDYYAALRGEAVKYARPFCQEYTGQAKASPFPYITYYSLDKDKSLRETTYSRSEFLALANRAWTSGGLVGVGAGVVTIVIVSMAMSPVLSDPRIPVTFT